MEIIDKIIEKVLSLFEFVAIGGLITLVVINLMNVFGRTIFNHPFGWVLEVSLIIFVYTVLLCVPRLYKKNDLITMTLLEENIPKEIYQYLDIGVELIILTFLILLIPSSSKLCWMQRHYLSRGIDFPRSFIILPLPLTGVFLGIINITKILSKVRGIYDERIRRRNLP